MQSLLLLHTITKILNACGTHKCVPNAQVVHIYCTYHTHIIHMCRIRAACYNLSICARCMHNVSMLGLDRIMQNVSMLHTSHMHTYSTVELHLWTLHICSTYTVYYYAAHTLLIWHTVMLYIYFCCMCLAHKMRNHM